MAKTKKTAPRALAPRTREDAEELIGQIGSAQREVTRIELEMNEALAAVKSKYESEARPFNASIERSFDAVRAYADEHRAELLKGDAKTVQLATGELTWKLDPPSVGVRDVDGVMERLRKRGLGEFIRQKDEINKQAILAQPARVAGIAGITITQKETFSVKPFETQIEHAVVTKAA